MLRDPNTEQLSESATHFVERLEDVSFDEVEAEREENIYREIESSLHERT